MLLEKFIKNLTTQHLIHMVMMLVALLVAKILIAWILYFVDGI